ncbi:uncharacterized protein LOC142170230 [Nicotiana tabacum]|uniref:Uncharacterized protein LOC142170230 n=1 Tax=Nicotiana tabacum TaxID=4097 RepID=A0AC58ST84_TOBAC
MLDRLAGRSYYYFLDGYSGYNQIIIAPKDQDKSNFTFRVLPKIHQGLFQGGESFVQIVRNDAKFMFNGQCMKAFELLNWIDLGAKGEQDVSFGVYVSKTMNDAQVNYMVTEKELLAIVFAMEKFRPYLMGAEVIVHIDHVTLHYLMTKKDSKARLMRWTLLLQEFDLEMVDWKETESHVADHLSRLEEEGRPKYGLEINDAFPDEQLLSVSLNSMPWFVDVTNFLVTGIVPSELSFNQKKKLKRDNLDYYWTSLIFSRFITMV